jgi:putative transposase
MARPLRIERRGGRFHATARGNEGRDIFRGDTDRYYFLELLSDMPERFGVRLHAYALMSNHFHLLIETPEANLSRSMQWLGVSYSMWFNQRHRRAGHLFQGRFSACIVEDDHGWQEVARYVHLNPVRLGRLGLGKAQQKGSRAGLVSRPDPKIVSERLRVLREYRWSSYRGYAGYSAPLAWVCAEPLSRLCGGKEASECRAALRQYTEQPIRQGALECPWNRLVAGLVLGTEAFARSLKQGLRIKEREQRQARDLARPAAWPEIITALEQAHGGEKWDQFSQRHGDWGRDAALWFGRRQGRLPLARLGELAGGMDYAAVSVAVRRFERRIAQDPKLRRTLEEIERTMLNVEM